jgi:hypothetical protein
MGRRGYGAYTGLEYGTVSGSTNRSPVAAGKLRFIVRTYYRLRRWSGLNMRPQAKYYFALRADRKRNIPSRDPIRKPYCGPIVGLRRRSGHLEIVEMDVAISSNEAVNNRGCLDRGE